MVTVATYKQGPLLDWHEVYDGHPASLRDALPSGMQQYVKNHSARLHSKTQQAADQTMATGAGGN